MLATGAAVIRAGVWRERRRFAALAPGFKIPMLIALVAAGLPAPVDSGGRGVAGNVQVTLAATAGREGRRATPGTEI
jgi:hypothetical protein